MTKNTSLSRRQFLTICGGMALSKSLVPVFSAPLSITAKDVMRFRKKTGAGIMDCKRTLVEANGSWPDAIRYLKVSAGKALRQYHHRTTPNGLVIGDLTLNAQSAALVKITCETDFAARTSEFRNLCQKLVGTILQHALTDVNDLHFAKLATGETVETALVSTFLRLKENIQIHQIIHQKVTKGCFFVIYIHHRNNIGALVELEGSSEDTKKRTLAKHIAMQVAAYNPSAISAEQMPTFLLETERKKIMSELKRDYGGRLSKGSFDRIVESRMRRFLKERLLLLQEYLFNPDMSVSDVLEEENTSVISFRRLELERRNLAGNQ